MFYYTKKSFYLDWFEQQIEVHYESNLNSISMFDIENEE